jgi:hypothetical protein
MTALAVGSEPTAGREPPLRGASQRQSEVPVDDLVAALGRGWLWPIHGRPALWVAGCHRHGRADMPGRAARRPSLYATTREWRSSPPRWDKRDDAHDGHDRHCARRSDSGRYLPPHPPASGRLDGHPGTDPDHDQPRRYNPRHGQLRHGNQIALGPHDLSPPFWQRWGGEGRAVPRCCYAAAGLVVVGCSAWVRARVRASWVALLRVWPRMGWRMRQVPCVWTVMAAVSVVPVVCGSRR